MKILLSNSLSGNLEEFIPIDKSHIKIYACGPTVYDTPHIGNARPLVVFDVLFRLLKSTYPSVSYIRNITDVDDKINNKARELGIHIKDLTCDVIDKFHKCISILNLLPVTHEPKATDHINEMIEIIQILISNGYAYEAEGHVLYRVRKNDQYGLLSKRNLNEMIAGNRIEIAHYKEDPMDFVLWKPSSDHPSWDSPFGFGRPGWHIECSAMSNKYLGSTFDIHAGGHDLIFPHHENEIAQNYGAFGCKMANYWIHNGMILVDGQKMSKSLGNIIKLDDILEKYDGETVRYALLSAHYQKTLDWNQDVINAAKQSLDRLYTALDGEISDNCENCSSEVALALSQNLNTPLALRKLHSLSDEIFKTHEEGEKANLRKKLKEEGKMLGLLYHSSKSWFRHETVNQNYIESLLKERAEAKNVKNYSLADEIRNNLLDMGVSIEDRRDGSTSWKHIN